LTGLTYHADKKPRVCILCGGKSPEHEVSLCSAMNVIKVLDRGKFDYFLVGIDKSGRWFYCPGDLEGKFITNTDTTLKLDTPSFRQVTFTGPTGGALVNIENGETVDHCDVVFTVLHGINGEDGTVQGLLTLAGVPYTGGGILGSALGMDKDMQKRVLRDAGIPVTKSITLYSYGAIPDFETAAGELGCPLISKPACSGSSIGVRKIQNKSEYADAVREAFSYAPKILLEEFIRGREVECYVLGNENPKAFSPGEVDMRGDLYSYEAKYQRAARWGIIYPAKTGEKTKAEIMRLAEKTFTVLEGSGFARVDFFLKEDDSILVNEINTIPGFTFLRSFPKEWEDAGFSCSSIITCIIELAVNRYIMYTKIKTCFK
jgi:D-alanine-D-alanine ligase